LQIYNPFYSYKYIL